MKSIPFKDIFLCFKNNLRKYKKYYILYVLLLLLGSASMISMNNIEHPKMELVIFLLLLIIGIVLITYYFSSKSKKKLYKLTFIIILIFGIISIFFMPICEPSDTSEHLVRSEITSRGILFPEYDGNNYTNYYFNGTEYVWDGTGFEVIQSVSQIIKHRYATFLTLDNADEPINHTLVKTYQCAEQNPFYGYLPQAFGILLAKFLNLNMIWLVWLPSIINLVCYAGIVSYAVKKTPILKIPILFTACLPVSMFQAASVSIDALIIAISILLIAYFLYMYKSEENKLNNRNIAIFLILTLIIGILKLPYLAFSLLLFAVPLKNFKNKNKTICYSIIGIILITILGIIWSEYAINALWHSHRAVHYLSSNVNLNDQLNFILSSKKNIILLIGEIAKCISIMNGTFLMGLPSNGPYTTPSEFVSMVILMIMGCVYFAYPKNETFTKKSKIIVLFVLIVIYVGICFIQFLTWSPVGNINIAGISPRYFVPLLILIPMIFGINNVKYKNKEFDNYIIIFTISFLAIMAISFVIGFY